MIARNLAVHVEVLSDVHIGTGTELVRDFDWVAPGDGWIYIADNDKLLETVFQRAEESGSNMVEVANTLAASTLADLQKMGWLTRADFGPSHDLFRYRLRGSPATINIREQIKDVFGQPYLPGSSLKGALEPSWLSGSTASQGQLRRSGGAIHRQRNLSSARSWQ